LGHVFTKLIDRNTTIPAKKSQIFSTAEDNQTTVEIHVLQGEREFANDNRTLGRFQLAGIPSAPRGIPQIEVAFDIDANGILNVSAKDLATNKQQSIVIKSSSGLSEEEVEKMKKDADSHAEEDKKKREVVDLKNQADQLIYSTEKTLKEHGDKVDAQTRTDIEQAVNRLKDVQKGEDASAIEKAIEAVTAASHRLAEEVYKASGAAAQTAGREGAPAGATAGKTQTEAGGKDDDVIDAEFEETN